LTKRKINYWIDTKQFDKLVFASKKGNYKIRLNLLSGIIGLLENVNIKNIPIELIDDKVQIISEKAMEILTSKFDKSDSELIKKINDKQEYWTEKELERESKIPTIKFRQTWKDNKDSMVRLKQIKQQIKKSMYGERWM
jgi:hypothetical protein